MSIVLATMSGPARWICEEMPAVSVCALKKIVEAFETTERESLLTEPTTGATIDCGFGDRRCTAKRSRFTANRMPTHIVPRYNKVRHVPGREAKPDMIGGAEIHLRDHDGCQSDTTGKPSQPVKPSRALWHG